ncbi:MAG: class I SAM-dependent methyltransferase [Anaerolinea sp.]|nr:class I SAM-dependent methyltransferase [Anaerolinea sp.]MCC6976036.1 class I SAM-dependent methyltransferase [Anaerolineae bacterium]
MQLETVPCDLCGAALSESVPYCTLPPTFPEAQEWRFRKCICCGLIALQPRPDRQSIGAFYPDLDYHAFQPDSGLKRWVKAWLNRVRVNQLRPHFPKGARLLEVGCGTGELLRAFGDVGYQVEGIEPNQAAVKVAQQQGLSVQVGNLESVVLPPQSYQGVIMKYALEHVHSPRQALTALESALKPGGRALLWLPNVESWDAGWFKSRWRGYDAPRHLYLFSPKTIESYLEKVGLKLMSIRFSPMPNDFAGSAGSMGLPAMALWFPISALAAARRASGRMLVVALKPSL